MDQQQASGTALAIVNRRAVLGAGARPSRVTAWPFVKSARLLSAEGHPANTEGWPWLSSFSFPILTGYAGIANAGATGHDSARIRSVLRRNSPPGNA